MEVKEIREKILKEAIGISTHNDADGVGAAVLLQAALGREVPVAVQKNFGEVAPGTNVVTDMVPLGDFTGYVIDHHPLHKEDRKYNLIYGQTPAGHVVWETFKDLIPQRQWWKVAVSLVGDGKSNMIPSEVFRAEPSLLHRTMSIYQKGSETNTYTWPIWMMVSSPVNALCKTGQEQVAYQVLKNVDTPIELINNPVVGEAKSMIKNEMQRVIRDGVFYTLKEVIVGFISSNYPLEKELATKLEASEKMTAMVVNTNTKNLSSRGVLSNLLREELALVVDMNGHPGYMGGKLKVTEKELIECLKGIKI